METGHVAGSTVWPLIGCHHLCGGLLRGSQVYSDMANGAISVTILVILLYTHTHSTMVATIGPQTNYYTSLSNGLLDLM